MPPRRILSRKRTYSRRESRGSQIAIDLETIPRAAMSIHSTLLRVPLHETRKKKGERFTTWGSDDESCRRTYQHVFSLVARRIQMNSPPQLRMPGRKTHRERPDSSAKRPMGDQRPTSRHDFGFLCKFLVWLDASGISMPILRLASAGLRYFRHPTV